MRGRGGSGKRPPSFVGCTTRNSGGPARGYGFSGCDGAARSWVGLGRISSIIPFLIAMFATSARSWPISGGWPGASQYRPRRRTARDVAGMHRRPRSVRTQWSRFERQSCRLRNRTAWTLLNFGICRMLAQRRALGEPNFGYKAADKPILIGRGKRQPKQRNPSATLLSGKDH